MSLPRQYPCYDNQLQENHCDANFDPLERQLLSQPGTRKGVKHQTPYNNETDRN